MCSSDLPNFMASRGLSVVYGAQHALLFVWPQTDERLVEYVSCDFVDRFQPEPVGFLVGRHPFIAIALEPVRMESLIDEVHHRNLVGIVSVVLRKNAITHGCHNCRFFRRKETYGWHLLNASRHDFSRGFVPECSLRKGVKSRVVPWLLTSFQRFARDWINRLGMVPRFAHLFSVRSIAVSAPRNPHAAKRSGAKIGGPYITL